MSEMMSGSVRWCWVTAMHHSVE